MAFESLRRRLLKAFGFGFKKPQTVIPKTRGQGFYRAYQGGDAGNLTQAIQNRQPVSFFYVDKWQPQGTPGAAGLRVGNPHAMWTGSNGRTYLHLYVDPQSATATGDLPGWRTFLVNRIQGVSIFEQGTTLFGKPVQFVRAPGWSPGWYSSQGTVLALIK